MKNLIAASLVLATFICLACKPTQPDEFHEYFIRITPETSKRCIDSTIACWQKDNIILSFSKLKYNAQGKLVKLQGKVYVNGSKGPVWATFKSDNLAYYEVSATTLPTVGVKGY